MKFFEGVEMYLVNGINLVLCYKDRNLSFYEGNEYISLDCLNRGNYFIYSGNNCCYNEKGEYIFVFVSVFFNLFGIMFIVYGYYYIV